MWLTNGVHVVDRLTWLMASQAVSVSASIGTRAHYQAADDTATALIRYKNGLAGVAVSIAFADGAPIFDTQVICANGTLRIGGGRQPFLQIGQGNEWKDIPYDDPPAVMHYEWKSFVESIEQDIEPPTSWRVEPPYHGDPLRGRELGHQRPRRGPGERPLLDPPARRHARHPSSRLDLKCAAMRLHRRGMKNRKPDFGPEPDLLITMNHKNLNNSYNTQERDRQTWRN